MVPTKGIILRFCLVFQSVLVVAQQRKQLVTSSSNMTTLTSYITVILALISYASAYSGGAPEGVCEDMTPKHPAPPQTSAFPYTVSVNKKEIKSNDEVEITISGGKPFKGFLLQVRDGDKPVGSFSIPATDKYAKTINCVGGKANAATHKNSAEKKSITLLWTPPANKKSANLRVYVTVAEDGGTYWVRKPTQQIKITA